MSSSDLFACKHTGRGDFADKARGEDQHYPGDDKHSYIKNKEGYPNRGDRDIVEVIGVGVEWHEVEIILRHDYPYADDVAYQKAKEGDAQSELHEDIAQQRSAGAQSGEQSDKAHLVGHDDQHAGYESDGRHYCHKSDHHPDIHIEHGEPAEI